jgi:hypothetical protein
MAPKSRYLKSFNHKVVIWTTNRPRRLYFTIFFNLLFPYFPIFFPLNCVCCHKFSAENFSVFMYNFIHFHVQNSGADPGFQVRGGSLKKIAPSGGRRDKFWGISCEKTRFYAKKSYSFQLRREARKMLGYFV